MPFDLGLLRVDLTGLEPVGRAGLEPATEGL
jgi:hypothetical protein